MGIDFTQKKNVQKPAGKAKIPSGFASRAKVPDVPNERTLDAASRKSPLHHPGDKQKDRTVRAEKKPGKSKRPSGLVPDIPIELYIRGTARTSVLIEGPEQTIGAFKAFVKRRGVKNWEGLQLLIQKETAGND